MEITVNYQIEDFESDVRLALLTSDTPQQYGAQVAAASKRYKASRVLEVVLRASNKHHWDLTPTLANNIIQQSWGRGINRNWLAERLNTPGRTAATKSRDLGRINELVEICKPGIMSKLENADFILKISKGKLPKFKDKPTPKDG